MDQELIAYLDKRFGEVNKRFDAVDGRLDGIDARLEGVDTRLDGVDTHLGGVDARLAGVDVSFVQVEGTVRGLGVQIEGLRGQIQQVAEGVAAGNQNLESFRTEVSEKFDEMGKLFHTSHSNLHSRVSALEARRAKRVERRT
ncbi:MAG TPA: hypothetical protein VNW71_14200 [Thermoanaerobaculia bacterium]|nr:hypothetical protein [Thermoanaerobaculia bacterium]